MLLYKDLTTLTSSVCGSPASELSFGFLLRPSTCLNILIVSFLTHLLLAVGYNAVLHVLARGDVPKVKGRIAIEKCVEHLKSEDLRTRYDAMTAVLRCTKSSFNARQTIFSLQDGHPVLWHVVYKEWVNSMTKFSKSIFDKPAEETEAVPTKTESSVKPGVGRPLGVEVKPTKLFSVKDDVVSPINTPIAGSRFSTLLSTVANEAAVTFKQTAKDYFVSSRIGKYMLTEQSEVVFENKLDQLRLMLDLSDLCGLLCCAAPTEDKYGVVQLVLPEILNTVATTLKAIEQVPIIGVNMSHTRLKRSLQLFLHQLTDTYQGSLFNLTLDLDTTALLQHYYTPNKEV